VLKVMNDGREEPRQLLQLPHKLPHAALHMIQIYISVEYNRLTPARPQPAHAVCMHVHT
jgi:hypothetical protein